MERVEQGVGEMEREREREAVMQAVCESDTVRLGDQDSELVGLKEPLVLTEEERERELDRVAERVKVGEGGLDREAVGHRVEEGQREEE